MATMLYETLSEYKKNQYNASVYIKKIVYCTEFFLNRMEQIKKITGVNLNDWNELHYLIISYHNIRKSLNENGLCKYYQYQKMEII
jgi:hypothetical protein